jgi:hypothetical protein
MNEIWEASLKINSVVEFFQRLPSLSAATRLFTGNHTHGDGPREVDRGFKILIKEHEPRTGQDRNFWSLIYDSSWEHPRPCGLQEVPSPAGFTSNGQPERISKPAVWGARLTNQNHCENSSYLSLYLNYFVNVFGCLYWCTLKNHCELIFILIFFVNVV